MNIQAKLKELMTDGGQIPYVFGSMPLINKLLDKVHSQKRFPVAISVQPINGTIQMGGNYNMTSRETEHVLIGFGDSIRLDYDAEAVQEKVEALKTRCRKLLGDIEDSCDFEPLDSVSYSVLFDSMDANLVIVLMDFNITERIGECI